MENVKKKIDENYEWFLHNKGSIPVSPDSKYVLVDNCTFLGDFKNPGEAYEWAGKNGLKAGFIVQAIDNRPNFLGYYSSVIG